MHLKRLCLVVVAATLAGSSVSNAAAPVASPSARIDGELKKCLDDPSSTTMSMIECLGTASEKMDKQLNGDYRALLAKLKPDQQEFLRDAQRKWLQYREAELKLAAAIDPNVGGSLARVSAADESYGLLKARVEQLEGYLAVERD